MMMAMLEAAEQLGSRPKGLQKGNEAANTPRRLPRPLQLNLEVMSKRIRAQKQFRRLEMDLRRP